MTKRFLVKTNGKDLNLVNGDRELWGMSSWFFLLRCFAEHKLPLETELAGFEPAYTGIKIQCLTAWRQFNGKAAVKPPIYYNNLIFSGISVCFIGSLVCVFSLIASQMPLNKSFTVS